MGGAHILIVDDGFFRSAVADSLSGLGYRLSFAEDVAGALAAINQAAVFRFVEKPFDPVTIRLAICCAVDDLERERDARRFAGWMREGGEAERRV